MLKKVTDEFANPEDGDALVEQCVTSVTTDRTMAEIAAGSRRLALEPRRPERRPRASSKAGAAPPPFQRAAAGDAGRRGADRQRLAPRI